MLWRRDERICIQSQLLGLANINGLNFDIFTTTKKEFLKNKISPILHQIKTYGIRVEVIS